MKTILKKYFNPFAKNSLALMGFMTKHITRKEKVVKLIESLHPLKFPNGLIRLGENGDGGYLVPDDLEGIEACFSPGVANVSEFELDCLEKNIKVFMADKSVEKPNLSIHESRYDFIRKFVGCTNNEDFITMDEWVKINLDSPTELILQMDIEGGEYISIINMSDELLKRFRIIVIEFHALNYLWDPDFYNIASTVFYKILQTHACVHIHPNNCCGVESILDIAIPRLAEFTFIRKDRIKNIEYASNFPHPLDYDNTNNPTITLPKIWYK